MKRCLKNHIIDLSPSEYNHIYNYLKLYNKCKNIFYNLYQNKFDIAHLPYKHELRDRLVKQLHNNTLPPEIDVVIRNAPSKLWKYALSEAITNIKANYSNLKNRVRQKIARHPSFSNEEKHYARYILTSVELTNRLNLNKSIKHIEKFPNVNQTKINNYLTRQLRKERSKKPYAKGNCFTLDGSSQFKYIKIGQHTYINFPTLIKNYRLDLKLSNKELLLNGDIQVVVHDKKVSLHKAFNTKVKPNTGSSLIGVYVGYDNIFQTSTGNLYGSEMKSIIEKWFTAIYVKEIYRKKLRFINNKNIQTHNLGMKKQNNVKNAITTELNSCINKAINDLIAEEMPHTIVMQPINKYIIQSQKEKLKNVDIKWLQRITNYLIATINERLLYKLQLNSINLEIVNSCYTAKACYNCGSLNTVVTDGFFKCNNCTVSTNRVAVTIANILKRYGDDRIAKTASGKEVKRLLEQEHSILSGLA